MISLGLYRCIKIRKESVWNEDHKLEQLLHLLWVEVVMNKEQTLVGRFAQCRLWLADASLSINMSELFVL